MSTPERERLVGELQQAIQRGTMHTVLLHHATATKAGINVTDLQCLNTLSLDGPQTPGQLAKIMGVTTGGAITAVIDRLEDAGYVKRTRDPDDRRRIIVETVPESMAKLSSYFGPISEQFAGYVPELSDEELRVLVRWSRANNAAMPEVIERIRNLPT